MRRLAPLLAALIGTALLGLAAAQPPADRASLEFLLCSPSAVKLGVSLDGRGVVYPLEFRKRYGPYPLEAGRHQLSVKLGAAPLRTSSHTFAAGGRYLAAVTGPAGDLSVVWVKLGLIGPAGAARLRLVNLIPDVPFMTLKRGADRIEAALAYKRASAAVTVPAGALPIEVGAAELNDRLLILGELKLEAGKGYTLVVLGTLAKPEYLVIVEPS